MADDGSVARYRTNLQGEVGSAALYRAMAEAEKDPHLSEVYRRLAAVEEAHAEFWRKQLGRLGATARARGPGWRTRALVSLARRFGPQFVLPTLSTLEQRDVGQYDRQPEAVAGGLPSAERSHNRIVEAMASALPAGASGSSLARLEGRHRGGGNALRAAVLGANDGLVSNLALVMGVAGAELQGRTILITGIAGLLAGSFSMALGEWLSVQSSRELYEHQIRTEAAEIEASPEEEAEELALIYQARGLGERESEVLARRILQDPKGALDVMTREELGIDPSQLGGSPWVAAFTSFALFATGAFIPVLPFLFGTGTKAVVGSLAVSALGLFG